VGARIFTTLIFLLGAYSTYAQLGWEHLPVLTYNGKEKSSAASSAFYLYDSSVTLTHLDLPLLQNFTPFSAPIPNLAQRKGAHWLVWKVKSLPRSNLSFHLANPVIDEVSFLVTDPQLKLLSSHTAGLLYPYVQRATNYQDFVFPIPTAEHPEVFVFMRLRSERQILLPIRIDTYQNLSYRLLLKDHVFGIYAGIILAMILYNIFLFFSVRDRNYLLYIFYILSVGLTQLVLNGYGQRFLWPGDVFLSAQSLNFSGILSGLGVLFFVKYFLHTFEYARWFDRLLNVFGAAYATSLLLSIAGWRLEAYNLINAVAGLGSISLLMAGSQIAWRGYRPARFFLIAFSIFLVGVIVHVLRDIGLLPYSVITNYALVIGSAIEVVLLSLALADRINMLTLEKEEARRHELQMLKENERLVKEQNIMLEQKVEERTEDLKFANAELNAALANLRNAQTQLVNAEKMASLGQLTAGIAHEINNPINFVTANISPLRRDVADVKVLLEKFEQVAAECNDPDVLLKMKDIKSSLDIDFTLQEIDELLYGINEGAQRTGEIVKSLRNFSRLDEDDSKFANIHEGIASTLVILRNHTKNNIVIEQELDPKMGNIECYPGKLNQVFSNLIMNAIQAIKEMKDKEDGKVHIATYWGENDVTIIIRDNGPGIPDKFKHRVFEPFFTTKEVGEGTGLGLSIVYSIIEAHKGKIEVKSTPGQGAEFLITLPKTLH
jgi:signal transduction histidine kinase